eukprot:COSAG01_NODE_48477_length_381_cov_0.528369_2_plen_47_part_01
MHALGGRFAQALRTLCALEGGRYPEHTAVYAQALAQLGEELARTQAA